MRFDTFGENFMHRSLTAMFMAGTAIVFATPALAAPPERIADQYICVFKAGAVGRDNAAAAADRIAKDNGGQVTHVYKNTIRGFATRMPAAQVSWMTTRNPNIAYCEQDQVMSIGPDARPGGGGGTPPPESTPPGITRVGGGVSASAHTAWVIDTGIELTHPDLNVDATASRNFVTRETSPNDLNGHGTHVSGTIAAKKGNGIGVVGVAPGNRLVAIRVLNKRGSGSNSDVIAGVDYVGGAATAGDVANMSLGGGVSQALDAAVVAASSGGVWFALAAGNDGGDANLHSPARANGTYIRTVSAVNVNDVFASFSNWGNPPVDFAEPGVSILSTWIGGGYNTISGTSMATPHMAGVLLKTNSGTNDGVCNGGTASGDPANPADIIGKIC